jgi:hypothetical protein
MLMITSLMSSRSSFSVGFIPMALMAQPSSLHTVQQCITATTQQQVSQQSLLPTVGKSSGKAIDIYTVHIYAIYFYGIYFFRTYFYKAYKFNVLTFVLEENY